MRKKFLIIIGILLMFGFALLLPGCKKTDNNPSGEPSGEDVKVEINFSEKTVSIKLGETYKINVEVKNANATFDYEIEDNTIISVANGVVTALKAGETNLKVRVKCDDEKETSQEFTIRVKVIEDEAKKVTISYSGNVEGFSKASDQATVGEDFKLGDGPFIAGYTFVGWSLTNSKDGEKVTEIKNVTEDVTVYGFYEVSKYTITYELDGGTYDGQTVFNYGDEIELDSPIKEGYMFVGWALEPGATRYIFEITVTKDITLYAIYMPNEYRITYDLDGGKYQGPTTVKHDEKIELGTPTKEGYDFLGWKFDINSEEFVTEFVGSKDITVFAIFEAKEYTITFELDGGTYDGPTTVKYDKILQLGTPTKEGYEFLGWSLTQGSTDYITRIYCRGEATIYANWVMLYTITYDLDGGDWFYEYLTQEEIGELFMADFNQFSGYSIGAAQLDTDNISAKKFGDMFIGTEYLDKWMWLLEAVWEQADGDESKKPDVADFTSDATRGFYLANLNGFFTNTKHTDTWYETVGADFSKADKVNAVIEKAPLKAGGKGPETYSFGVGVETLPTPARDGYNFIKWVDASGNEVTSISDTQTGNVTLKAVWEAKPDEYNVTYELDGGSYEGPVKVTRGDTLQLGTPTKSGFAFLGWTKEIGSTSYITEVVVSDNITLYANWIDENTEFTVTYELNEGTYDGLTSVKYGTTLQLGEATKQSYKFLGWGLTSSATEYVTEIVVKEDITLYAIFTLNEYTITYDLDGGEWETVYYTPEELGEMFMAEFNAFANYKLTPDKLDTDNLSGKKFGDFFVAEGNLDKWYWLLDAICDLVENSDTLRPGVCDFANDGIRGFYLANLNGFFTSTQHTDTWYESQGVDFSIPENSKAVCEKGSTKQNKGPETYLETVGVESFPAPVREGFTFSKWVDANGNEVTSISDVQTGNITLKAVWIAK